MGTTVDKWKSLGEFEHLLLLAVMRLGEDAYGVTIRREIEDRTGRPVSLGSIYPTMDRLEERGYVRSWRSTPTKTRGGRSRRYFQMQPDGVTVLRRAHEMHLAMWDGHDPDGREPA